MMFLHGKTLSREYNVSLAIANIKKIMRKYFLTIFATLLFITNFQGSAQTLNLASDIWPPFTNSDKEKSIALEIVHQALAQSGVASKTSILKFKDVLKGLKSNSYDGSAAFWKTEKREEIMLFSEPYLQNQLVLVANKNTNVNNPNLKGKKLGLIAGYAYGSELTNDKSIELVFSKSNQQNLEKLLSGEIDYFLVDNLLIQYMLKYQVNNVNKYLEISKQPYSKKSLHFAINKNIPNAKKIIADFNLEINKMMKDGSYNKIMALDRIKVDLDKDGVSEIILSENTSSIENDGPSYSLFYDQTKSKGFYVNNKHYPDWESVPNRYKNNMITKNNAQPKPIGLQIKI
jgi:polar amino acid transport system substrate-binding protein